MYCTATSIQQSQPNSEHCLTLTMLELTVYACGLQYCYLLTEACPCNCILPLAVVTADLENAL